MTLVNKCCCCCLDLRQGSLVIGVLSLLLIGFVEIAVAVLGILYPDIARKNIKFENALFFDAESEVAVYVFFGIVILVAIIYIIVCALLIYGVRYKKPFLLIPWILFTFMNMIMAAAGGLLYIINSQDATHIISGVIALVISGTWVYFTVVVFSFFQALQNGDYW